MSLHTIGLIADTHGLLRPEALAALQGCQHIVHAGDIGTADILARLAAIAPVTAVRGNNDHGPWAEALPERTVLTLGEVSILVLHILAELRTPAAELGVDVVVYGHSHKPSCQRRDGIWWINPGSAGPRRFRLPIAAARLHVDGRHIEPELFELPVA